MKTLCYRTKLLLRYVIYCVTHLSFCEIFFSRTCFLWSFPYTQLLIIKCYFLLRWRMAGIETSSHTFFDNKIIFCMTLYSPSFVYILFSSGSRKTVGVKNIKSTRSLRPCFSSILRKQGPHSRETIESAPVNKDLFSQIVHLSISALWDVSNF